MMSKFVKVYFQKEKNPPPLLLTHARKNMTYERKNVRANRTVGVSGVNAKDVTL